MNITIAKNRISSVVKPDSITASQGDFLATHVAIKKLSVLDKFSLVPETSSYFSEEEIYRQYVLNPNNEHQFIAVYGQSGTGKSHLIRWLDAKFQNDRPDNEVVLFVRRSDNTLKGTIRQLLAMPEVCNIANKDVYDRLVKATVYEDENKLKGKIYYDFINEVEYDEDKHKIRLNNIKRKRLLAFLQNEVVKSHLMSDDGPIERIYSKIAEHTMVDRDTVAQFEARDFYVTTDLYDAIQQAGADSKAIKLASQLMADDSGHEEAEKIAIYLNQFVGEVIQRSAGIEAGDFRLIFQDIRKELYVLGKNLTLFIEDITSFTGVDDALLDALIVEHTGMNANDRMCRISSIVGTTSNYLQNNFKDNHKDRITKYLYIPSDVFDEASVYEFVARYLNTMSLENAQISDWVTRGAKSSEYPVHEVTDGALWDFVTTSDGKQLNLYPFTKRSILYLYNNRLGKGHQTPRYIIRDIIEPVVTEVISSIESFPSEQFKIVVNNGSLSNAVNNRISDSNEANRLINFLTIWGDGEPEQYNKDGITYVSSIDKRILAELKFPDFNFAIVQSAQSAAIKKTSPNSGSEHVANNQNPAIKVVNTPEISQEKKAELEKAYDNVNQANAKFTEWVNGATIDVSATVGIVGVIKAAQEDFSSYIYSAINWQSEGISNDYIEKVKTQYKNNFVMFENQTKGSGIHILPATWESANVLMSFVRWKQLGKKGWSYKESALDAFVVTGWLSKYKKLLVEKVKSFDASEISYVEAAVITEVYRDILIGKFTGQTIREYGKEYLFLPDPENSEKTSHSSEWNKLKSALSLKADEVRETIHKYFNIPQGESSSMLVLNDLQIESLLSKIRTSRLSVPSNLPSESGIKKFGEIYNLLRKIIESINKVVAAEIELASPIISNIYSNFDDEEIEADDIIEVATKIKEFYNEINKTQINIQSVPTDDIKNNAQRIESAISKVGSALEQSDNLSVLLAFSSDPVSDLKMLYALFNKVQEHIKSVDVQITNIKASLGAVESKRETDKFRAELDVLDYGLNLF